MLLKEQFDDLVIRITTVDDGECRAPGYNKADDIDDGKEINQYKDAQSMFKQVFFKGVDAAPDHYPPSTIDTAANATKTSNKSTVATMIQTAVNSAKEARDEVDKKEYRRATPTPANPTPSNPKQTCGHCKEAVQTSIHTGIAEEKYFINPVAMQCRPHWARNKLEEKGIESKTLRQAADLGERHE